MKEAEKGVIGESIRGEGGGDDFLRYFKGTVFALIVRSWKFRASVDLGFGFGRGPMVGLQSTKLIV